MSGRLAPHPADRAGTPLLGLRRKPGRIALSIFRLPVHLYRRGWGWLLGDTFLLLVHLGRKSGQQRSTVAMVLRFDHDTGEAVICSVWGQDTDWIRNIRVRPALRVQIGGRSFVPTQRFLSTAESLAVVTEFRRRHPWRLRFFSWILGWDDLRCDPAAADFVRSRPFVALRPVA